MSKKIYLIVVILFICTGALFSQANPSPINKDELYIPYSNKIVKVDLTDSKPNPVDVITGLNTPTSLVFNEDILYYVEGGKIYTADVNLVAPVPDELVIHGLTHAHSLRFDGDDLYITRFGGLDVYLVDINDPDLILIDSATGDAVTY